MPSPPQRTRGHLGMVHLPPIVVFGRSERFSLFATRASAKGKGKEQSTNTEEASNSGRDDMHYAGPSGRGTFLDGDDTDSSSEDEGDDDPKKLQHQRKQDQSLREALSNRMRIRVRVTKARSKTRGADETTWQERIFVSVQQWLKACLGDDDAEEDWAASERKSQHRLSQYVHEYDHQHQHQHPAPYRQPLVISAPMMSPNSAATSFIRTRDDAGAKAIRRASTYSNYSTHSGY
jgi:hypothetical protein